MEGKNVTVEADVSDGLPGLILVWDIWPRRSGKAETGCGRRSNLGLSLPPKKITINLSPADFRKEGTGFDLAIAAAILSAYGGFRAKDLKDAVLFGELGLDGTVRGIPGVMALTDQARESGFKRVFLPVENVKEGILYRGDFALRCQDLRHLWICCQTSYAGGVTGKHGPRCRIPMNRYDVDFSELSVSRCSSGQPVWQPPENIIF